jgi:multidrug efflux pump subunit AcrA (membrane-fusion protein)
MSHPFRATYAVIVLGGLAFATVHAASPVEIAQSELRPVVQVVNVSGTVTSPQSAILSPSIGGLVEKTLARRGDAERGCPRSGSRGSSPAKRRASPA